MRAFEYLQPATVEEAVLRAGSSDTKFLAGGTNLVDLMKLGVECPRVLVDVSRLTDSGLVDLDDGGLYIGAGTRNSELAATQSVRSRYPVLAQALLAGASGQLRNMATVGGNLLQRTRCRYFQDPSAPCNKREPGSGCPAIAGDHHNRAILEGSSHCVATHPSDMAVALSALDATIHYTDHGGPHTLALHDLYRAPGSTPRLDTTLGHDSLITGVSLNRETIGWRSTYQKVRERATFAFALVSIATVVQVDDGKIGDIRIAFGGVAHRPWRARRAEEILRGSPATTELFEAAINEELSAARPLPNNAYKVPLARNLAVASLVKLSALTS